MANHTKSDPHNNQTIDKDLMLDWWVGTVFFTFFPLILTAFISLCTSGTINFFRLFGDGELILSAFLVTLPSLLKLYNLGTDKAASKRLFYFLLIVALLQLGAYSSIKVNPDRLPSAVYVASIFCVLASIIIARSTEKHLIKEASVNAK